MIERNLTVTVNNNTSTLNEKLVFYARDRGILIHFLIKDVKYMFSNSTILGSMEPPLRAEIYALKPNGKDAIRFDSVTVRENTVDFVLTETLTDDLDEVGIYKLQIVIYSDNNGGRLAIPPFEFEVKDLLTRTEGTRQVAYSDDNVATIDNFDYGVASTSETLTSSGFNTDTMQFDTVKNQDLMFPSGGVLYAHKLNNVFNVINDACDAMPNYIMRETYDELEGKTIPQAISEIEATDTTDIENRLDSTIQRVNGLDSSISGIIDQLPNKSDVGHTHDQYLTEHQDLSNYALKSELPSVDGLATTDYVDSNDTELSNRIGDVVQRVDNHDSEIESTRNSMVILMTEIHGDYLPNGTKSEYGLKDEIHGFTDHNGNVHLVGLKERVMALENATPNTEGLATEDFVNNAIEEALGTIATQLDEINGEEI